MNLVSVFESLAADTWKRLRDAQHLDVRFGEESVTDLVLLELKRKRHPGLQVLQTNKNVESTQGTDWEWWLGSDSQGWLRLAVQAKRLSDANESNTATPRRKPRTRAVVDADDSEAQIWWTAKDGSKASAVFRIAGWCRQPTYVSTWERELIEASDRRDREAGVTPFQNATSVRLLRPKSPTRESGPTKLKGR